MQSVGGDEELLDDASQPGALLPGGRDALDESTFGLGVVFLPDLLYDPFFYFFLNAQLAPPHPVLFVRVLLPLPPRLLLPAAHPHPHHHNLLFCWSTHRRVRTTLHQLVLLLLTLPRLSQRLHSSVQHWQLGRGLPV